MTRGASVHGLPALRQMPGNKWLEIAMIRMNHKGVRMDGPTCGQQRTATFGSGRTRQAGEGDGMGVISMKLVGDAAFTRHEDRQAAMRFAFRQRGCGCSHGRLQESAGGG